ncbi:hypothetical protein [Streptomyces sp. NPDC006552]|uniref:hypothetical protein n=1 Tax=Streptomyces sp. NPDC006552 TaxID=3157179 RepID=UPI0033A93F89
MSARYEVADADTTPLRLLTVDDGPHELGADLPPGASALVIGDPQAAAFAVTGTLDQLRAFAARATTATAAQHGQPALRLHDYNELAAQAADFINTHDARVDAFRLPAEEGQDPRTADIDPSKYAAYFDMCADWGADALDLVAQNPHQAPPA